jgi:hypothetical protein
MLILAAVLSACSPTIVAESQLPSRTISVTGAGQVTLAPDIAYIYIGVHTEAASATEAVSDNSTKTQKVTDALKELGLAKEDIRTTNFSIWPSQQYGPDGKLTGTIYMVDNTIYVTVRDIEKLGELLDTTIQAGANSINSIQFDLEDKTEALSQARKAAVENAKKQAKELADAAGVKLGEIQTIGFYEATPVSMFDGKGGGGVALEAAVPIQPGQLTLTVTVNLTYELK